MRNLPNNKKAKLVYECIMCRICFIETGTAYMRANDAIQADQKNLLRALSHKQRELIALLEAIAQEALDLSAEVE
jgi:hypothetical protein